MKRIGLISDTHRLLRPEAVAALQGCLHIVHAGDIVDPSNLTQLAQIAPVTAVRGNNDKGAWAGRLRETETLTVSGVTLFVIHDLKLLKPKDLPAGVRVVVSGHSHKPQVRDEAGVLYVNPGSAGPRRFKLPVSVAELVVLPGGEIEARLLRIV